MRQILNRKNLKYITIGCLILFFLIAVAINIYHRFSGEWVEGVRVERGKAWFPCNVREFKKGCVSFLSDPIDKAGKYRYLLVGSSLQPYEGQFPLWVRLPCGTELDLSTDCVSLLKEKATSVRDVTNERLFDWQHAYRFGGWPNQTEELRMGSWFFYVQRNAIVAFKVSYFRDHWPWAESHTPALGVNDDVSESLCFYEFPLSYAEVKDVFGRPDGIKDYLSANKSSTTKYRICDFFEEIYSAQTNLTVSVEPKYLRLVNPYTNFTYKVTFSNGTDRLVVLATNDIRLEGNLAVVTGEKMRTAKSCSEMVDLGLFGGSGHWGLPKLAELEPGDSYVHRCELHNAIMRGVSRTDKNADLFVVFYGWTNGYRAGNYMLGAFPKELHPYVWTKPVTSMPVRIDFEVTGQEWQRHR